MSVMTITNSFDPSSSLYQDMVMNLTAKDGELYDQYPSVTHNNFLVAIKEPAGQLGLDTSCYGVYDGNTGHIDQIPDSQYQGMMAL